MRFTKRNLLAILSGFLVFAGIGIIIAIISVSTIKSVFPQQPSPVFVLLLKAASYFSLLIGGFIVGWIVREKGWIFGGLLGTILAFISIGLVALPLLSLDLFFGPEFTSGHGEEIALEGIQRRISNQFLDMPVTILLTSLGGFLGTYLYKRKKEQQT